LTVISDLDDARERLKLQRKLYRTHMTDRTTSLIENVNNKRDECSGLQMKWQKVSSGTEKGTGRQQREAIKSAYMGH
jgi:hypothetical protein